MLCDSCHQREATHRLTFTVASGEPLDSTPDPKQFTAVQLATSSFAEFLGLEVKTKEEKHYCEKCALSLSSGVDKPKAATKRARARAWKEIQDADAAVSFYLTGESIIRAATFPNPPKSTRPAIVRVSHSNCYGPVDSDIYVRLGNPKKPLGVQDFDKVSDWRKARRVEDLIESDDDGWKPRGKTKGIGSYWCGTYEVDISFPKGWHQIELKIISRVEEVRSIVLSNWKIYVR